MENNQLNSLASILNMMKSPNEAARKQAAGSIMSKMSKDDSEAFREIASDKDKISEILNSPAARQLMEKLNRNGQHK